MKNYCIVVGFCLLLVSCSLPPVYYGSRLKPTHSVDIYYSPVAIKRPYREIGYFTIHNYPESTIRKSLVKYAKSAGADAIIILGIEPMRPGQPKLIKARAVKYGRKGDEHDI